MQGQINTPAVETTEAAVIVSTITEDQIAAAQALLAAANIQPPISPDISEAPVSTTDNFNTESADDSEADNGVIDLTKKLELEEKFQQMINNPQYWTKASRIKRLEDALVFPNEFSQVILNLLSNAGEAVKAKCAVEGIIKIRLFERDGLGCVSISDNGGGIAVDVIDKIFEPYFSTKEMGTGIGLYMSKMIIERSMKGTIEVHNIDGGAEFVVSIPLGETL